MCLAIPMKVLRLDGGVAEVEVDGNVMSTDISLLEEVKVGDYVIIHAGIAIQKYDEEEAEKTLELIREIAELEGA
jgi:hydrogenase expression/formation protein HypC